MITDGRVGCCVSAATPSSSWTESCVGLLRQEVLAQVYKRCTLRLRQQCIHSRVFGADERATAGVLVGASVAALMTFAPAYAGVTLEQPKLKNVRLSVYYSVSSSTCCVLPLSTVFGVASFSARSHCHSGSDPRATLHNTSISERCY